MAPRMRRSAPKSAGKSGAQKKQGADKSASAQQKGASASSSGSGTPVQNDEQAKPLYTRTVAFCLGAQYSCVCLPPTAPGLRGEVIADRHGERRIPCYVATASPDLAAPDNLVAGTDAYAQRIRNVRGTVTGFFPLIGLPHSDPRVQQAATWMNVSVAQNEENKDLDAVFALHNDNTETPFVNLTAAQLTTRMLVALVDAAESHLGAKVTKALLTHPAEFSETQVQAYKDAAAAAGLDDVVFACDPVCALLAHEVHEKNGESLSALNLVVDVGASCTKVSLVQSDAGMYSLVHSHTSDFKLSAQALDLVIAKQVCKTTDFKTDDDTCNETDLSELVPKDIQSNSVARLFARVMAASEDTRRQLSRMISGSFFVEAATSDGSDVSVSLTRLRFEMLCTNWRNELQDNLITVIETANLIECEIDNVLLVGGGAHMPLARATLTSLFGDSVVVPHNSVQPDDYVALGAGLLAFNNETKKQDDPASEQVPHLVYPVGLLDNKNRFRTLIPKFTALPATLKFKLELPVPGNLSKGISLCFAEGREIAPVPERNEDETQENVQDDDFEPLYEGVLISECTLKDAKENTPVHCLEIEVSISSDANEMSATVVGFGKNNKEIAAKTFTLSA